MRLRSQGATRVLCFDLENRPLAYWYDGQTTSEITAFGWKWADEDETRTLLLQRDGRFLCDDGRRISDRKAYGRFVGELASAGLVFGHNIRRHDLPILDAALLRRQLPPLPVLLTTDTCRDIPKAGGMSKSLQNLAAMYDLEGEKHSMSQPAWEAANRLTPGGVSEARVRVVSDVVLQERLREKLLELRILREPQKWSP